MSDHAFIFFYVPCIPCIPCIQSTGTENVHETALTTTKLKLATSQTQLRHAENKAEECECRLREAEASLVSVREDATVRMAAVFLSRLNEVLVRQVICSVMSGYSAITGDYLILETNLANYSDVSDSDGANGSRISIKSGRGSSSTRIVFVGQTSDPTSKSPARRLMLSYLLPGN